jgi:hypothetical protein
MKRIIFFVALVLATLSTNVRAQFEGVIDFKHTMGDGAQARNTTVTVSIKDRLMAFTPHEKGEIGSGKVIYRGDKHVMWIIDEKKQTYLEIDVADTAADQQNATPDKPKMTIHKTGKTQTILGYPCEEVIVESDNESHDLWCTSKLGKVFEGVAKSFGKMSHGRGNTGATEWRKEFMAMNEFPLKTVSTKKGRVTEIEEVTNIEQKSLPAAMFDVPEGYKQQSLGGATGDMMKQLQEQMKNRDAGGGKPGQNVDMEKLMKEMQEKIKSLKKDKDTTQGKDNE